MKTTCNSKDPIKLTVYSTFGDPLNPHTWSGTPFNICQVLKDYNNLDKTYDCLSFENLVLKTVISTFSYLYYQGNKKHYQGQFIRRMRSGYLTKFLADGSNNNILHFGVDHLPLQPKDIARSQRHYLYIDGTFNLSQQYQFKNDRLPNRLIRDWEQAQKIVYEQMTHIFAISEHLKDNLISHYKVNPSKITVVGTGRGNISPFFGNKNYEMPTILFVAKRGFELKGGDLVVEGFRLAYQQNPKLRLIIAGHSRYPQQYSNIPGISTYGFISQKQLQELYNSSSIFAMPARYEPWGLVYLEALSCKMPLIGFNRFSLPEITQNGRFGFLMSEETPEAFANCLLDACTQSEKLKIMGEQGQEYCLKNFTWEHTVETMLSIIKLQTSQNSVEVF